MSAFILSIENLSYLKATIRERLPNQKSSHLTEAIAFGLGFKSNASLRLHISTKPSSARIFIFETTKFFERLASFGSKSSNTTNVQQIVDLSCLPHPCLKVFQRDDTLTNNTHYRHCINFEIPMVFIHTHRKYCTLNWDCITLPTEKCHFIAGAGGNELGRSLHTTFRKQSSEKGYFWGSAFVGTVEKLTPSVAINLANEFFLQLYDASRRAIPKAA